MVEYLFVYGTLMDPCVQQRIFGRVIPGEPDSLAGYQKYNIPLGRAVYPIIRPKAGGQVVGLVLPVSPAELAQADYYEGDSYRRKRVTLASGRPAWVYQE